jgi:hypothetical protein
MNLGSLWSINGLLTIFLSHCQFLGSFWATDELIAIKRCIYWSIFGSVLTAVILLKPNVCFSGNRNFSNPMFPINTTVDSPKPSVGKKLTKNRQLVKKWDVNQKYSKSRPKTAR